MNTTKTVKPQASVYAKRQEQFAAVALRALFPNTQAKKLA